MEIKEGVTMLDLDRRRVGNSQVHEEERRTNLIFVIVCRSEQTTLIISSNRVLIKNKLTKFFHVKPPKHF